MASNEIPAGTWKLDATTTSVTVTAKNFVFRSVPATLAVTSGQAVVAETLETSVIEFSLDAGSFDTGNAKRDEHVRSNDFLDAETHPSIDFRSDAISKAGAGYRATGSLRVAGNSTTVSIDISNVAIDAETLTFHAEANVDRREIGIDKMPGLMIGYPLEVVVEGTATQTGG